MTLVSSRVMSLNACVFYCRSECVWLCRSPFTFLYVPKKITLFCCRINVSCFAVDSRVILIKLVLLYCSFQFRVSIVCFRSISFLICAWFGVFLFLIVFVLFYFSIVVPLPVRFFEWAMSQNDAFFETKTSLWSQLFAKIGYSQKQMQSLLTFRERMKAQYTMHKEVSRLVVPSFTLSFFREAL